MWKTYQRAPAMAGAFTRCSSISHPISISPILAPRPSLASHTLYTPNHAIQAPSRASTRIAAGPEGNGASSPATSPTGNGAAPAAQPQFGLRQITGDGRCMFRALVQGAHFCAKLDAEQPPSFLSPTAETAAADDLRNRICDALLAQRDRFEPFIASDEGASFEAYVETMRQSTTFGGEPELAAAADVIARPITVFRLDTAARQLALSSEYLPAEGIGNEGDWPVPLVYHAAGPQSGHYDLLAPMDASEDSNEPGLEM